MGRDIKGTVTGPAPPQDPRDTAAWMAYNAALYPDKVELRDATEPERREWNRKVRVYRMIPAVRRHLSDQQGATVIQMPRRTLGPGGRPRAQAARSSAASGDSGDDDPPPADAPSLKELHSRLRAVQVTLN